MKTALVAGATGLIGSQLLNLLLADNRYGKVIAMTRQPLNKVSPRLVNIIADGDTLEEFRETMAADDVFCCLGTTMKKAKSEAAFRKVDFEYPLKLAQVSKALGAKQYLLVSALGASKTSSIFYNRVKGETEEAIGAVGFESFHILRPSLLLGQRKEERAAEDAAKWIYRALGFLIPAAYKGIESAKVARAMITLSGLEMKGIHVHESKALQSY